MEHVTVDHKEIQEWIEKRQGKPTKIDDLGTEADDIGLHIDFPGTADEKYFAKDKLPIHISWKEFFEIFELQNLAFIYNDDESPPSLAFRFMKRGATDEEIGSLLEEAMS